jgi:hypothetical protein
MHDGSAVYEFVDLPAGMLDGRCVSSGNRAATVGFWLSRERDILRRWQSRAYAYIYDDRKGEAADACAEAR